MRENNFAVEKAILRKGLISGWFGPLVITPDTLFFISLVEFGSNTMFSYPAIGRASIRSAREARRILDEKTDQEFNKLGQDYTDKLDYLVVEKENSIKINKMDIIWCKVPKKYYLQTGNPNQGVMYVKTMERKYEVFFEEPKKVIPLLRDYLQNNLFLLK